MFGLMSILVKTIDIKLAGVLLCYTRQEGIDWDWIADMPIYIPRGDRLIIEVSLDGVLSIKREAL